MTILSPRVEVGVRERRICSRGSRKIPKLQKTPSLELEDASDALVRSSISNITLLALLGSGGFGSVFKGVMEGVGAVAVKRLHSSTKNEEAKKESFRAELHILHLHHPHVVKGLASYAPGGDEEGLLIMEHVGDRNLQQIINSPDEVIDINRRMKYSHQLAQALSYVHSELIVHLDVKPANILVTSRDDVKLADFGCCQVLEENTGVVTTHSDSQLTGTFAYRAPELLKGKPPTPKADIYSLGITFWQLVSRTLPYENENPHVVVYAVVAFRKRPAIQPLEDLHSIADRQYQETFVKCWGNEQKERPTAQMLVSLFSKWKGDSPNEL